MLTFNMLLHAGWLSVCICIEKHAALNRKETIFCAIDLFKGVSLSLHLSMNLICRREAVEDDGSFWLRDGLGNESV